MAVLSSEVRRLLERTVVGARSSAEVGCRVELERLGVLADRPPDRLSESDRVARRHLRVRLRQLGGDFGVLVGEAAYEQWHRLLFARFLVENGLLMHPEYGARLTMDDCADLAESLGEPDGWAVAGRYASEILPGVFRLDDPLTQLRLAPEHRVALERAVEGLPAEVFTSDDGLGWVYQFWQSEAKDEVNASERKIGGADLAPVTQLFTENYMVRFLLENSLGAWWAARYPGSPLVKDFEYLRFDEKGAPAAGSFEGWPDRVAEVTVMDPCCGSGHFLVEAFEMLWRMRAEEEGLSPADAQDAVLRDNLFGLELDPRCTELAAFNLVLAAWKAGGHRTLPVPNVACSGLAVKATLEEWTALAGGDARVEAALERLHVLFRDADTLGSLIDPRRAAEMDDVSGQRRLDSVAWAEVEPVLVKATAREATDPAAAVLGSDAAAIARAADYLSRQYTLITTNVPFLSRSKQDEVLREHLERYYERGSADLATAFLLWGVSHGSTTALVTPQNWHHQGSYRMLREHLLEHSGYRLFARLGDNCWQKQSSDPLFKFHTVLSVIGDRHHPSQTASGIDIGSGPAESKPTELRSATPVVSEWKQQLENPDSRITLRAIGSGPLLSDYCRVHTGVQTGDTERYMRKFWELVAFGAWIPLQSTVTEPQTYGGRSQSLLWESGCGALSKQEGAYLRNQHVWGSFGVAVKQMGVLQSTLYRGDAFDNNVAVVTPRDSVDLPAVWCFLSSPDYNAAVRRINARSGVTTADLVKVPFDVECWRGVAAERYPDGLPEPWSDDPTQWLFEGDPAVAKEPLQVAVARLMGYRWPEQPEETALDRHSDMDGIVCLPAVGGEQSAAVRLRALLADAFGSDWSGSMERRLIAATGSKKKNLEDWLWDDYFKQHCKVFGNRPFVWHVWDGRKDGFSALVHYHRLDRSLLEKLTFATLGWWIERQRADAGRGEPGAAERLGAANDLQGRLKLILEGEAPYDVFVRWKELWEQPIGWDPDLDDGVRLNIRPFIQANVLRWSPSIRWGQDRGGVADGTAPRLNDLHLDLEVKSQARTN